MTEQTGEIRHAARRLLRAPAFTVPSVLTLGLAIGANGAIFTVVQRVVLNPLPYEDSAAWFKSTTACRCSRFRTASGSRQASTSTTPSAPAPSKTWRYSTPAMRR